MMTQPNTASITWEIENFVNFERLKRSENSPNFETKQNQMLFYLKYKPNASNDMNICSIRLEPCTTNQKVLWSISLINNKGEKCYPKDIETKYTVKSKFSPIEGGFYHLALDTILNPSSGLLPGGNLFVKCTVTILDGENSADTNDDNKITLAQKKILKNYQSLLESSKYSDFVFVVGKKEFKLHKNILASQSPVFAAMFESELDEAKQNRGEITDIDVEVFEAMIRFIYTGNVDSVKQCALDLFVAADKYQLDSLKDICADHLSSNLSIDSVANILLVADMHSEAELKSKCIEFINNKNTTKVFATDGWKVLVKSRVELALELYHNLANKFENK